MPRMIACAIVRHDPPDVYAAEDLDSLNWVLALRVVAATPAAAVPAGVRDSLRSALLEERWGDAVEGWIRHTDIAVDVYPSMELYVPTDVEMAPVEMQFLPLFEDEPPA
jgi:hypothetical protein